MEGGERALERKGGTEGERLTLDLTLSRMGEGEIENEGEREIQYVLLDIIKDGGAANIRVCPPKTQNLKYIFSHIRISIFS